MNRFQRRAFALLLVGALLCLGTADPQPAAGQTAAPSPNPVPVVSQPGQHHTWTTYSHVGSEEIQLVQKYAKSTSDEEKKELKKKLTDLLVQQFDNHQQQQQKELDELEKQIKQLRETLKKRQDAKNSIVERRLEQLVHEADGLGWTAPHGNSGYNSRIYQNNFVSPQSK